MRLIKRGKKYSDVEKAAADLRSLQEQFPQVAIPAPNKLFIMVYGKDDNGKPGITKYVFEIKATEDCKFYIAYELNNHAKEKKEAKKAPVVAPTSPSAPQEAMGKFTSGVLLRRNKKRK